jgi:hypothetical protein
MKLRRHADNPPSDPGREEIREIAEALGLWRSAMRHIAENAPARPFVPERRPGFHFRLLLAPALTAAVAAGIFFPLYSHSHRHLITVRPRVAAVRRNPAAVANVDDTALMNQIDSELSQDVPDALEPLADLSDQAATTNTASEKKNVTHE